MAKHPYLTRVGKRGTLKYRRAVPKTLREAIGRREIVESFRTNDLEAALPRYHMVAEKVDRMFADAGKERSRTRDVVVEDYRRELDVQTLAEEHYQRVLMREQKFRSTTTNAYRERPERLRRGDLVELAEPFDQARFRMRNPRFARTSDHELLANAYRRRSFDRIAMLNDLRMVADVGALVDAFDANDSLSGDPEQSSELADALAAAEVRALKELLSGNTQSSVKTAHVSTNSSAPSLSHVIDSWIHEIRVENNGISGEREHLCRRVMTDFIDVAGDKPIDAYRKSDGREFKSILFRLPANIEKRKSIRGTGPRDLRKIADASERAGVPAQSTTSVKKKLGIVNQCFRWLLGAYDECEANPVEGLQIKTRRNVREERQPFDTAQLNKMFSAPVFTGCETETSWKNPGTTILRSSAKFWVPLIGLFTGMRSNEICQLGRNDVKQHDGIWYFSLSPSLRLKNTSSIRNVPVHAFLLDAGFATFVVSRTGRLFPDLVEHKSGRHSDSFGKHFRRFLHSLEIKRPDQDFHSFRHNFSDAATVSGLEFAHSERILGHALPGQAKRYGQDYKLELSDMDLLHVRNEQLQQLRYPGLEIEHLAR